MSDGKQEVDFQYAGNLDQFEPVVLADVAQGLLDSLQEIVSALVALGFDGELERKARAAISKATGE